MSVLHNAVAHIKCDDPRHPDVNDFIVETGIAFNPTLKLRELGWGASDDGLKHQCPPCRNAAIRRN